MNSFPNVYEGDAFWKLIFGDEAGVGATSSAVVDLGFCTRHIKQRIDQSRFTEHNQLQNTNFTRIKVRSVNLNPKKYFQIGRR